MIRLQTLGFLDLRNGEGSELRAVLAQPKRLALLAYLGVANPHGFHRRDTILSLFWPERDAEHSRAALNRAVYFLRRELGDAVVRSRGDEEIGLDPRHFWSDAAAFDAAVEKHQYREASGLYRGELLPGFFVSEAPGFETWLEGQRARLRECASDAAWTLAKQEEAAGNFALAAEWARKGVELAPFHEAAFRRLLALLERAGDRAGAVHAYARFSHELAKELDLSPSPETRAQIEAIRIRSPGPVRTEPGSSPAPPPSPPLPAEPQTGYRGRAWWVGATAVAVLALVGNAIVLSVQDRIREHAVLQTLGYGGSLVARLIVAEGLLLGLIGGGTGIVAALAAVHWGNVSISSDGLSVHMTAGLSVVVIGLVASATLGVVAGLVPAIQASRREITQCFRAV